MNTNVRRGEFADIAETAEFLDKSPHTLAKYRMYGGGPDFIRVSSRKILYRWSVLDAWMAARTYTSIDGAEPVLATTVAAAPAAPVNVEPIAAAPAATLAAPAPARRGRPPKPAPPPPPRRRRKSAQQEFA